MAKQSVNISFSGGLDTKTDEKQVPVGKFLVLQNSVFQKGGLLTKRNGYGVLPGTPEPSSAYLTTFNNNLVAIGKTVNAYSPTTQTWITKGNLQPASLNVMPLIRNNINQTQTDSATSNGFVCVVYTQNNGVTASYLYAIQNATTGQNIVAPTVLPILTSGTISGSSQVLVVGNYFVIVSPVVITGTSYLQYVSIPINNPSIISSAQNIYPESFTQVGTVPSWDAISINDNLVVAYNTTIGGQGVHVTALTASQIANGFISGILHAFTNAAYIGAIITLSSDSNNNVYISFWNNSTTNGYTTSIVVGFGAITVNFAPVQSITSKTVSNLTSVVSSGSCKLFIEITNNYSYDAGIASHYISSVSISSAGVVGILFVVIRSVGLASKAFIINGVIYFLSTYKSTYQSTYFLINASLSTSANPIIVAKLAYQNGGGYLTLGLPNISISNNIAQISYLYKQNVQALSTVNNTQQTSTGGIYSQLGINLVSFVLGTQDISSAEIGKDLHLSGGYLSMFDGYYPVEHNFFLFPDNVETSWSATGGSMVAQPDGITNTNAYYYQVTYEWTDMQGNAFKSQPSISVAVTTSGALSTGQVTLNIPTLRLTAKIANAVKIVIYRWSVHTQVYNQVTSIDVPTLNDTTIDSITYVDKLADSSVIGNNLIYTTGGAVPNANAPSSDIMCLFDTRLWLVNAEDPNVFWISKSVVEGAPVDMSLLFTIYVAPNIGTTGSSGPITAAAPMDDKIIIFKKNSIFYINGTGPDDLGTTSQGCSLGNYSQPIYITSVVGCANQQSIVLTQDGLMFQSDKGIWLLNRSLQTEYIGAPVEAYNSSLVTSANVIPGTNHVLFSLNTGEMLMYDYYYGQWGTFTGVTNVSSCIYNGLHTILNKFDQILQETPNLYLDGTNPVLMNFTTSWFNLASLQGYERFYEFYILAKYLSPHKLLAQVSYDYNPSFFHQSLITPNNFSPSIPSPFGVITPLGSPTSLEQWRIHAKQQLCQSFQLSISEIFDANFGVSAGAGFTMSGITCILSTKKTTRPIREANAVG